MKVYGNDKDTQKPCPTCKAPIGVYCAASSNGPLVHERRVVKESNE